MTQLDPPHDPRTTQAARDWIARLSSGEISEAELASYRRWAADSAHEAVFQHELALWRSLGAIGDRLVPRSPLCAPSLARHRRHPWAGYAAAAVAAGIVVLISAPEIALRLKADYRTDAAVRSLTLPDGSHAVLDANSAIALRYDGAQRRIELLRGRAWFDVAHGDKRPFRVAADGGLVEDVGTAFEVAEDTQHAEVAVTAGAVRVSGKGEAGPWMQLTAGERAAWTTGRAANREPNTPASRIATWRDGDVLLDAVPVRQAIQEIGRYRPGPTFITGDVDALAPVTAIVRTDRPDEGLEAVAAIARLQIIRLPAGVAVVRPAG